MALVGYLECQEESNDCSSEEEVLVEAIQHYELVNGDNDFRAINVGMDLGVRTKSMFTKLVIMAIVSTFMATPLIRWLMRGQERATAR